MPAQNHLCRGDPVRGCDTFDRAISSVQISAAGHRRIRFHCNAVRLAVFHNLALLPGRVQFDLVDGRIFTGFLIQAVKMFGHEIAHAQCAHAVFRTKLLECLPRFAGTPVERRRPVQHVHVHVVELQQTQLPVERLARGIVPLFRIAQLRGHPQILAMLALREARIAQRTPHTGLVVVSRGTVDVPIAGFQRALNYGSNALIVDAQYAQTDLRNQIAVGKRNHRSMESSHGNNPLNRICDVLHTSLAGGVTAVTIPCR